MDKPAGLVRGVSKPAGSRHHGHHGHVGGDAEEQRQYAETMPDMMHADANTLSYEPGKTKSLVWQFTRPGNLEVACHIPRHYEAGMRSPVVVVR